MFFSIATNKLDNFPYAGNFCASVYNKNQGSIKIKSDQYRGFPIYVDQNVVLKLTPSKQTIWTKGLMIGIDIRYIHASRNFLKNNLTEKTV